MLQVCAGQIEEYYEYNTEPATKLSSIWLSGIWRFGLWCVINIFIKSFLPGEIVDILKYFTLESKNIYNMNQQFCKCDQKDASKNERKRFAK